MLASIYSFIPFHQKYYYKQDQEKNQSKEVQNFIDKTEKWTCLRIINCIQIRKISEACDVARKNLNLNLYFFNVLQKYLILMYKKSLNSSLKDITLLKLNQIMKGNRQVKYLQVDQDSLLYGNNSIKQKICVLLIGCKFVPLIEMNFCISKQQIQFSNY